MAVELVMPRLSDTMEEGTVVTWLIADGQAVAQGQEIAEIETDKSTVPYEAPESGVLRILVPEGATLRLGQPIGLIDDLTPLPGGQAPGLPPEPQRSPAWGPLGAAGHAGVDEDEGETTEFAALDPAADGTSATYDETPGVVEAAYAEDVYGAEDEFDLPTQEHAAAELPFTQPPVPPTPPTPPADLVAQQLPPLPIPDVPAPEAVTDPAPLPVIPDVPAAHIPPAETQAAANPWGEPAPAAEPIPVAEPASVDEPAAADEGRFTPDQLIAPPTTAPPRPPEQRPAPAAGAPRVQASPVARRLAEQLGIDLAEIEGTGPEGRVVRADIEAAQAQGLARPPMPAGTAPAAQSEFTPPDSAAPQPPIPPVEPTPVPVAPAPEVPQPVEPTPVPVAPAPEVPQPVEPTPEPTEPTAPQPEPEVPAQPEPAEPAQPHVPEPDVPQPTPEPAPVEPQPEPEHQPELEAEVPAPAEPVREQVTMPAALPGGGKGEPTVVALSRQGQTIARRMAESKATIPHYAVRAEVDAEPILQLRTELSSTRPELAPPSINDLVVRATALALRANPSLNGTYRDGRVELFPRINIGVPVAIDDGLPVPVIQDVDRLSLGQIAERSAELIEKARAGELRPADVASATFTVTNLGMYGVDEFTAVITPGQAGILTVGQVAARPVVKDGELVAGQTMRLTLLVDHRAVYGAPAARFLARVQQLLERPTSLLA